jgi:hypothetical protein
LAAYGADAELKRPFSPLRVRQKNKAHEAYIGGGIGTFSARAPVGDAPGAGPRPPGFDDRGVHNLPAVSGRYPGRRDGSTDGLARMVKRMKAGLLLLACLVWPLAATADCAAGGSEKPYQGPLFDAMAQIDGGMYDTVLAAMDDARVQRMALFARVKRKGSGESDVMALKKRFPERFVIGTPKWFDLRGDLSSLFISQTLSKLREGPYQFVGEILFAHGDKSHGEQTAAGERYLSAEGPNVLRLMKELQALQVPVMTHWEVYDWARDWPVFHQLYEKFPDLTFIWPHSGFGSAAQAETALSQHPNVIITLSKLEKDQRSLSSTEKAEQLGGAIVDECGAILPEWRAVIDKFPTRFMFATDAHKDFRWAKYGDVVARWRDILGQLPEGEAKMIAWENAERVYGKPH